MLKWFIIGTLLYYAILLWRYRDSLGTWFTGGKREPEQPGSKPTVKTGNGDSLVGASRYRMGQMRTNGDIETEETDISLDEIEAEEIACYMGDGEPEMAQGITLGELGQMIQVIQIKQASEAEERQAVQTICRTETNLFHSLVEQINGGRSRVAELLQKHEIPVPAIVPVAGNDEMADFDMNDFL